MFKTSNHSHFLCFNIRLILTGLAGVLGASESPGLTGDWGLRLQENSPPLTSMWPADPDAIPEILIAEGLRSSGVYLQESLLGTKDTPLSVLIDSLDPELSRELEKPDSPYRFQLVEQSIFQGVTHKTYQLRMGDLDVYGSLLKIHESADMGIQLIRAKWPTLSQWPATAEPPLLTLEAVKAQQQLSGETLPSGPNDTTMPTEVKVRPVIFFLEEKPVTCWEVIRSQAGGGQETQLIDGRQGSHGNVIFSEVLRFDLASVYEKNPKAGGLIATSLERLKPSGFLDSDLFSVFGAKDGGSLEDQKRVPFPGQKSALDPNSDLERPGFDQIQTYYYADRSLNWMLEHFGPDQGPEIKPISIYVGGTINGRTDNAIYLPTPAGPAVVIAQSERFDNLARDRDVVTHELAHHIIYRGIKSSQGESGMLHEGTADYLAYALSNDPYLAESVVPGAPYLRTALLGPNLRYDSLSSKAGNHIKGQYWSAMLWRLGERVGHPRVLGWIRSMLLYAGPRSGIKDALLGLIRADRDLVYESQKQPNPESESPLRAQDCAILEEAVAIGFAGYLADFDGAGCGLNLPQLAQKSLARVEEVRKGAKSSSKKTAGCGVLAGKAGSSPGMPFLFLFICLAIPLGGFRKFSRKGANDGYR